MRYRPITRNKEFSRAYARGKSYVHPKLVMYVIKNRVGHTRVGLTATKKVGCAVERNRARRVIRAALIMCCPTMWARWILCSWPEDRPLDANPEKWRRLPASCLRKQGSFRDRSAFAGSYPILSKIHLSAPWQELPLCAHLQPVRTGSTGNARSVQGTFAECLADPTLQPFWKVRLRPGTPKRALDQRRPKTALKGFFAIPLVTCRTARGQVLR